MALKVHAHYMDISYLEILLMQIVASLIVNLSELMLF